jgi:hypothetical protein
MALWKDLIGKQDEAEGPIKLLEVSVERRETLKVWGALPGQLCSGPHTVEGFPQIWSGYLQSVNTYLFHPVPSFGTINSFSKGLSFRSNPR